MGRPAHSQRRPARAALWSPSRSAMSGGFSNQAARTPPKSRDGLQAEPAALAAATMAALTTRYAPAPALLAAGARGRSTDAMPGRQALARQGPPRRLAPGHAARRACAYSRRGPWTWSAHGDVAQGPVGAPARGPTRPAEDVVNPRAHPIPWAPAVTRWPFVTANLNMPQAAGLVRLVAEHDALTDALGPKGPRGLLRSLRTRAACLAEPTHHIVCHSPPKPASWMHQRELGGRMVVRQGRKRASVTAVEDVNTRG